MPSESKVKAWLLSMVLMVGGVALTVLPLIYFTKQRYVEASIELGGGLGLWLLWLLVRKTHYYKLPAIMAWVIVASILVITLFTGGIDSTGLVWWSLLPLISFMLFGINGGIIGVSIGLGLMLLAATLSLFDETLVYYHLSQIRQASFMILVLSILSYASEKFSLTLRKDLMDKSKTLEEEIKKRVTADIELKKNYLLLKSNKDKQDEIRAAMFNLLEDSQELEKRLAVEKEGVEQKVTLRTKELSESNARLISAINSVPRIFVVVDRNQEVIVHNDKMELILGVKQEDWTVKLIDQLLGEKINISEKIEEAISQSKSIESEGLEYKNQFLNLFVAPIFLESEKAPIGAVLTIEDVTERKVLERSKDEFFSIASHELRTPLTAIRGNTAMIQEYFPDALKDPELRSMIKDIHESSIRLIDIVNDFLNVSRLEQGKMEFKIEELDIKEIVESIVAEFVSAGLKDGVKLCFEPPKSGVPSVKGDVGKVKQVLINLVGNALKFTEKGNVEICLEVMNDAVKVRVADSGRGIPVKQQNLLFRKFQQAGESLFTRDTVGGTGLGLYISRKMIEGMGGEIMLESSEENKGSVFYFTLPLF